MSQLARARAALLLLAYAALIWSPQGAGRRFAQVNLVLWYQYGTPYGALSGHWSRPSWL
ncbi:MAG: hypothetical protein ACRDS0_31195 [Pseudonocardiaceae bacterium]